MKIAFDVSPLKNSSRFRGVGTYTRCLLEALNKSPSIKIVEFADGKIPAGTDLIHYSYFFPFVLSLPFFFKQPLIVTVHDVIPLVFPKAYPPGLSGKMRFWVQRQLLTKVSAVITDSQSSAKDISRFLGYPQRKISVIYLAPASGIKKEEDGDDLTALKNKYHLPDNFVLYVGDVNYNKNLPGLVRACRIAKTPLVIVGKQAVSQDFDATHIENQPLVELNRLIGKKNDIIRTGFVSEKELSGLYTLAGLFCMPSFYEGFGIQILEAMACGCPVVTSNVSSLPEVAGEAAVLVDPYSIDQIASGIKKLIEDEKYRQQIIKTGFVQAKKFSWEKTARETIKVYEKVLEK